MDPGVEVTGTCSSCVSHIVLILGNLEVWESVSAKLISCAEFYFYTNVLKIFQMRKTMMVSVRMLLYTYVDLELICCAY